MMKNLDALAQEQKAREELEKLEQEAFTEDVPGSCTGELLPQAGGEDNDRMFTKAEVQQLVAAAVARERVNVECREYMLAHFYGMEHVSEEIDRVLRILEPGSVDDLAAKLEDIEALDSDGGPATSAGTSSKGMATSLRQIFVRS